ncbi:YndJ family protein [Jeotgalibacillus sp. ET6]|uniref:YndJ family protein n=1 Tax=Jeotgalibacillus sp. ET6 TaxID=3037260 RepID=UPI002418388C|nr:YndJ family protein [Jeotgalibacillus sp. ET6]MDG5472911.1 YndJ family protein [Jeotgalibacillus sp. ET6]
MKIRTVMGFIVWLACTYFFSLGTIDSALIFSIAFLTPLLLKMVAGRKTDGDEYSKRLLFKAIHWHWIFAAAGVLAILLPDGGWGVFAAAGWFLFTVVIALIGLLRFMERGMKDWEEITFHFGFMYMGEGGAWLVLSRMDGSFFLPYSEIIIDLTAIHFHYAAFCVLILTGMFGRWMKHHSYSLSSRFPYLAAGLILGPVMVAVGLDAGPPLEPVLVAVYVVFLTWLSAEWFTASFKMNGWKKAGILISSLVLPLTMMLSVLYSIGLMMNSPLVGIGEMIPWHGGVNAFVFSFVAVVTWSAFHLPEKNPPLRFPISLIRAEGNVTRKEEWFTHENRPGLIRNWNDYVRPGFDPAGIEDSIRQFYLNTAQFDMKADLKWHGMFLPLSSLTRILTKRFGQLNLPPSSRFAMTGTIKKVSAQDGRPHGATAWLRDHSSTAEPIFTALYSSHSYKGVVFMNIALPLPFGAMTAVLLPEHDENKGLILTSERKNKNDHLQQGVYLTIGSVTFRTPFTEFFHVHGKELTAVHKMKFLGFNLLTIKYELPMRSEGQAADTGSGH